MNESLAIYSKPLAAEDFIAWYRQRTNLITLICLILEILVVAASVAASIIGLTRHTAAVSSLVTELVLVFLLLGFVVYWRFGYPKTAGLRYSRKVEKEGLQRVTTFYADKFQIKAGDTVEATVLYSDIRSCKVKHGLLTVDGPKHISYIFRQDGFSAEELDTITSAIKNAKEN